MTIRDDLYAVIKRSSHIGTGPDGQPWLLWSATGELYCLADDVDLSTFGGVMAAAYHGEHGKVLDDGKYASAVITLLVREAMLAPPLPEVTEDIVVARGGATADKEPIDLSHGEVATVNELLARLPDHDDLFKTGLSLTRLLRDSEDQLVLAPMTKANDLANWCAKRGIVFTGKDPRAGRVTTRFLPTREAGIVLTRREWGGVRKVVGISSMPVVRQDGSVAQSVGYDAATNLVIDPDPDLRGVEIPEVPTRRDVLAARGRLLDLYAEFPWDPERNPQASLANALALLFTLHLRRTFPGMPAPLFAVDAHTQASGKTLVAGDLPGAWGGGGRALLTLDSTEPEIRKRLTTEMKTGGTGVLCYDNIEPGTIFKSPFIAAMLTSETYDDRLLGGNAKLVVQQSRTLTVTGNRLALDADMARRAVLVCLDPDVARPEAREFKIRLDDPAERRRLRPQVVADLLTCLMAWIQADAFDASVPTPFRQFTTWATRTGGLLEYLEIPGFLTNTDLLSEVDDRAVQMGVLWRLLFEKHGTTTWTAAEAAEAVEEQPALDEELPSWISGLIVREPGGRMTPKALKEVASKIGYTARSHAGTYYDGLRLEKSGTAHKKVTTWLLREERR
jgi:hypothetical protein